MGFVPPPLQIVNFDEKCDELRKMGMPLTMRNIDPGFSHWLETCNGLSPIIYLLSKLFGKQWHIDSRMDEVMFD